MDYERFLRFCERKDIRLTIWQEAVSYLFYSSGLGIEKSFLLKLLYEFENQK